MESSEVRFLMYRAAEDEVAVNALVKDDTISVGYRVNSHRATAFRIWATGILKEYMLKGFAMDDERLKQGQTLFARTIFESHHPPYSIKNNTIRLDGVGAASCFPSAHTRKGWVGRKRDSPTA